MGIFEYDAELHDQVLREESWMEGKAVGVAEGMTTGIAKGKAESVLELLEELGPVSKELRDEIMSQKDLDILKRWHTAAARAENLEEWMESCLSPVHDCPSGNTR